MAKSKSADSPIPPVSAWMQNGFHGFLRRYLRRHFHAVAIDRRAQDRVEVPVDEPLIVFANHPSWWDPLTAHFLNSVLWPQRQFYAPIDSAALEQYKVFGKLGFYGVEAETKNGAADFLRTSNAILDKPNTSIWVTPEGRFADARDTTGPMMPGLAHLCHKAKRGTALPLAFEYVFWDERLPLCLVSCGTPIGLADNTLTKQDWSQRLDDALRGAQASLAAIAIARSAEPFENLLAGKKGAGVFYDTFRRLKAFATGREFRRSHGDQF